MRQEITGYEVQWITTKGINKQSLLTIEDAKVPFKYGNCALVAISQMTGINEVGLIIIAESLGIKHSRVEGLSFSQIVKLMNRISKASRAEEYSYVPNKTGVTFFQLVTVLNRDKIMVMFDEHLSFAMNGIVYDSYFTGLSTRVSKYIPTGWWIEH